MNVTRVINIQYYYRSYEKRERTKKIMYKKTAIIICHSPNYNNNNITLIFVVLMLNTQECSKNCYEKRKNQNRSWFYITQETTILYLHYNHHRHHYHWRSLETLLIDSLVWKKNQNKKPKKEIRAIMNICMEWSNGSYIYCIQ